MAGAGVVYQKNRPSVILLFTQLFLYSCNRVSVGMDQLAPWSSHSQVESSTNLVGGVARSCDAVSSSVCPFSMTTRMDGLMYILFLSIVILFCNMFFTLVYIDALLWLAAEAMAVEVVVVLRAVVVDGAHHGLVDARLVAVAETGDECPCC